MDKLTIHSLGGGALEEKFQVEVDRVIDNIRDENTPAEAVRVITLTVKIKPDKTRQMASVTVASTVKLAADDPFPTQMFIDREGVAFANDPRQEEMFQRAGVSKVGGKPKPKAEKGNGNE